MGKSKQEKKQALERLRRARQRLDECDVWNYEQRNQEVAEAEKAVWLGRQRGWDY